jgi:putative ABC transport system substrate-binding protein
MNRRETIRALAALAAASAASAVGAAPPFRIALFPDLDLESRDAFTRALAKLGWNEGRDYVIEDSGQGGAELARAPSTPAPAGRFGQISSGMVAGAPKQDTREMHADTRRLAAGKPDLILATSTAYARHAQSVAPAIPVVMWTGGYPVEAGIAESLAHPGRNATGSTIYAGTGVWGKLVELLREVQPSARQVGVLWDYVPPAFPREEIDPCQRELERAARALGLGLRLIELGAAEELDAAFAALERDKTDALIVTSGWPIARSRHRVMSYAARRRLPVAVDFRWRSTVDPYPLLVYGAHEDELMRIAASYSVRILKGARPADLPIQQPTRFELIVNLRTAKQLGIAVPQQVLLRADDVLR